MRNMTLSIIIKARNEEQNIERAITSSLKTLEGIGGEVILADSCSTDGTVAIARRYPVKIVQLGKPEEACCGIGPELGFRESRGDYVFLLDGDMEIDAEFVRKGISMLEADPSLAGVGGYIREMRMANLTFQRRTVRQMAQMSKSPKETESLSGGGLYRRASLESIGYMSDRNLHSYEEYDLGTRLRAAGWHLIVLPERSADHYSYDLSTLALMWHRLKGGSFLGQGEILRAGFHSGYAGLAVREIRALRISLTLLSVWLLILGAGALFGFAMALSIAGAALATTAALLSLKHRSISSALHSLVTWHLCAGGLLAGLVKPRTPPMAAIEKKIFTITSVDPIAARSLAESASLLASQSQAALRG